jgi:CRP-like cAMP-binding protein
MLADLESFATLSRPCEARPTRHPQGLEAKTPVCQHAAGSIIEPEGSFEPRLRILLTGWAARARFLPDGRRQIVRVLIPGDLCGVTRPNTPTTAATIALTQARTADQGALTGLDPSDPSHSRLDALISANVAAEQAALLTHLLRIGRMTAYERTAHFLLELHERLTRANLGQGRVLPLALTQEMIADTLGLSAVHINRVLQDMRESGRIYYSRGRFAIPDPMRLAATCGYQFEAPSADAAETPVRANRAGRSG